MKDAKRVKKYARRIISLYVNSQVSAELKQQVMEWICAARPDDEVDAVLQEYLDSFPHTETPATYSTLAALRRKLGIQTSADLDAEARNLYDSLSDPAHNPGAGYYGRRSVRRRLGAGRILGRVAAVLLPLALVAGGVYFYMNRSAVPAADPVAVTVAQPAVPVAVDLTSQAKLSDGTQIWAQKGCHIDRTGDREVNLSGEAYFSVAHDAVKPFVIHTGHLTLTVLGTKFNVTAHPDDHYTTVSLYSGKLQVQAGAQQYTLQPGNSLRYDNLTGKATMSRSTDTLPGWLASNLQFSSAPLGEILRTIGWYYGVQLQIDARLDTKERYRFNIYPEESLDGVLNSLETVSGTFTHAVGNDTVTIQAKDK